ncbi:hypothetical protein D3C87_1853190 [compost metagenome]
MLTFRADFDAEDGTWAEDLHIEAAKGAEVRVRVSFPEDRNAEAAEFVARVRRDLGHAHTLQIETKSVPVNRVRAGAIAKAQTPAEKLGAYWAATETPDNLTAAGALVKLGELLKEVV